jgi:hypothetical protein
MKFGFSFVTLASAAVLALTAGMAQARPGNGEGQAIWKAQAAKAIGAWYQAEAHFFEGMTPAQIQHLRNQFERWHQFQDRTIHRSGSRTASASANDTVQPESASIGYVDGQISTCWGLTCDAEYLGSVRDASPSSNASSPNPPSATYNDGAGT